MSTAFVALGSNLGDRRENLERALRQLQSIGRVVEVSSVVDTEPEGSAVAPRYLNAVAEIDTELEPRALLDALLDIERRLGRRRSVAGAPRVLDLDLLLYEDQVLSEPGLSVPHPRMHRRSFVLGPLVEIAPDLVHPVLQRTIADLARALQPTSSVSEQSDRF